MITKAQADRIGKEWIEAWNSHDLDRILSHYSEDFVMSSPHTREFLGQKPGDQFRFDSISGTAVTTGQVLLDVLPRKARHRMG